MNTTKEFSKEFDSGYKFVPDQELLIFANYFSDHYKQLNVGEYFSDNKKYQIKYLDRIKDEITGHELTTGARVSQETGIIEIDKFIFKRDEYTSDFIFFIILWCVVCNQQENKEDVKLADKITLEYYLTTQRSKKNILIGYVETFGQSPTILNKERYEIISKKLIKLK